MIIRHDFGNRASRGFEPGVYNDLCPPPRTVGVGTTSLLVGLETHVWRPGPPDSVSGEVFVSPARFMCFTEACLKRIAPSVILSPLFHAGFDAVDMVGKLGKLGFSGRYLALAWRLPSPGMVEKELKSAAPDLEIRVVQMV